MRPSYVTVTDQFCGAGGSSLGAVAAGAELKLAMNHWPLAIDTHNSNFVDADHACCDISSIDPRSFLSTDILITSPECRAHSYASGRKRPTLQTGLWDNPKSDPAAERSRATMWDVPRFAEVHDYRLIVVENVLQIKDWVLFNAWLTAMHALDYKHQVVCFNSMHVPPTPQSRDRVYIVFHKRGNPRPNIDIRPWAPCFHCERNVQAMQTWKRPGNHWGRYRSQYVYSCPDCLRTVEPYTSG